MFTLWFVSYTDWQVIDNIVQENEILNCLLYNVYLINGKRVWNREHWGKFNIIINIYIIITIWKNASWCDKLIQSINNISDTTFVSHGKKVNARGRYCGWFIDVLCGQWSAKYESGFISRRNAHLYWCVESWKHWII